MKVYAKQRLHLTREISAGVRSDTEKMFRRMFANYIPQAAHGFCLKTVAISGETSKNEETRISFVHSKLAGLELSLMSNTVDVSGSNSLPFAEEESMILSESGLEVNILLNKRRSVAQLMGVESRFEITPLGEYMAL